MTETYGAYGGRYVPETLIPALDELTAAWEEAFADESFRAELDELARTYSGRPTPLTRAERFAPGKRLYLKREDLLHTGAHKLNNALGQAVLARRLGKQRIVAETGAGQHGVATATVCARFGLDCVVYMGAEDMRRQKPNVERMGLLGAEVRPVEFGTKTLKEATSEAIRDWITNVEDTHYLIGSCVGPAPYPELDGANLGAEEAHTLDVRALAAHVLGAHVDDAVEAEAGADGCGRDAVLARARLGDDPPLAEPLREHRLAERVVQLVRAGVEEIFALQVKPLRGGEPLCAGERRRPARIGPGEVVELGAERLVGESLGPRARELVERRDQRLGDVAAAVGAVRGAHPRAAST